MSKSDKNLKNIIDLQLRREMTIVFNQQNQSIGMSIQLCGWNRVLKLAVALDDYTSRAFQMAFFKRPMSSSLLKNPETIGFPIGAES